MNKSKVSFFENNENSLKSSITSLHENYNKIITDIKLKQEDDDVEVINKCK